MSVNSLLERKPFFETFCELSSNFGKGPRLQRTSLHPRPISGFPHASGSADRLRVAGAVTSTCVYTFADTARRPWVPRGSLGTALRIRVGRRARAEGEPEPFLQGGPRLEGPREGALVEINPFGLQSAKDGTGSGQGGGSSGEDGGPRVVPPAREPRRRETWAPREPRAVLSASSEPRADASAHTHRPPQLPLTPSVLPYLPAPALGPQFGPSNRQMGLLKGKSGLCGYSVLV